MSGSFTPTYNLVLKPSTPRMLEQIGSVIALFTIIRRARVYKSWPMVVSTVSRSSCDDSVSFGYADADKDAPAGRLFTREKIEVWSVLYFDLTRLG